MDITGCQFIIKNYQEISLPFLNFIPSVGGCILEVTGKLLLLKDKFKEYHKENQVDTKKEIIDFINDFNKLKGTICESDFYTELICSVIDTLKVMAKK